MLSSFQCLYAHDTAFPLPSDKINEYPFNVVGKVATQEIPSSSSDNYYTWWEGSGTAISEKLVLTAAHVFYDDGVLAWYPSPFRWNWKHSPSNQSFDMHSRAYRHFSDYAEATRRFQPDDGTYSYEQFNLDVIALIFFEDVANGGYAGWGPNKITSNFEKMIVGYPNLNYSSSDPRRDTMHSTSLEGSPARYRLARYDDRLNNTRRVYLTDDLSAGPGNSGGPVYGLMTFSDGTVDWGVVGIHVGGVSGESSTAVGIDDEVYDLIIAAKSASGETTLDDHGNTTDTATTVELNRYISGNLETEGDIDYFRFSLRDEGTTTISTTGGTDTLGTLRNNLGNFVTSDDDSGSGENFLITRELNPGTYYIAVSHFSNEETGKYSLRVNFTKTIKLPDLVVDSVGASKNTIKAGESIYVTLKTSNKGDKNSSSFNHGIYLSKDRTITTSDRLLANLSPISMNSGASRTFSQEVAIPSNVTPGTLYIGYIVDTGKKVQEKSKTNNTGYIAITVARPALDLVLSGSGYVAGENIRHPNDNVFNQILLTGQFIKFKAKSQQITRVSFLDVNGDIVQVEFSGEGTVSITLDPATYKPPAFPSRYNQSVKYVTGKPSFVIEGADSSTYFSVFTVGRIIAVNQALFPEGQTYDAMADIKLVEIVKSEGFGGMQLSNAFFSGSSGKVGVIASGVPIAVRLTIGDIDASGNAVPYIFFQRKGSFTVQAPNPGVRITGGDLLQSNGARIVVSKFETLISQDNYKSDFTYLPAQPIKANFVNEQGNKVELRIEIVSTERPITTFVPKSFNEKIYRLVITSYDTDFSALGFHGDTSGTFVYLEGWVDDKINREKSTIGDFRVRVDPFDSNVVHITMVPEEMFFSADDEIFLFGTVEEMVIAFGNLALPKLLETKMTFSTSTSDIYEINYTYTDGELGLEYGTFKQIR